MVKALLVIDVQEELFKKGVYNGGKILENINRILFKFHENTEDVFIFRHNNDSFLKMNASGWEIKSELLLDNSDFIIDKNKSSVFKEKKFLALLKEKMIDTIVVTGLVTNGCIQVACTDGIKEGLKVILISDAHSTFHKDAASLIPSWNQKLAEEGVEVISTDDYIDRF